MLGVSWTDSPMKWIDQIKAAMNGSSPLHKCTRREAVRDTSVDKSLRAIPTRKKW